MPSLREWSKADPNIPMLLSAYAGVASHAEGVPGVGKSTVIYQWAANAKRDMMLLIGSTHAPEDFSGIPFVSECKTFFRQTPPEWAARLAQPGAVLFLDELTTVPPSVRAAMLSMLTERRLGSLQIHRHCLWVFWVVRKHRRKHHVFRVFFCVPKYRFLVFARRNVKIGNRISRRIKSEVFQRANFCMKPIFRGIKIVVRPMNRNGTIASVS